MQSAKNQPMKTAYHIDKARFFMAIFLIKLIAFIAMGGFSLSANAQFFNKKKTLLSKEEAFKVSATVVDDELIVTWNIATNDYYLYRQNFDIIAKDDGLDLGELQFSQGVIENDPEFGEVEVYFQRAELRTKIKAFSQQADQINITAKAQGCNKSIGLCYPPMQSSLSIPLPADFAVNSANNSTLTVGTNNVHQIKPKSNKANNRSSEGLFSLIFTAFIAGLALSFTPCVLPMIPILAGVISQQQSSHRLHSGWLATCYVAGTITTYLIAGAIAGATGSQLQAYFQNIWVIGVVCLLLVILACSLFGAFKIQLPSSIQTSLQNSKISTKSASLTSYLLGLISALVIGACVSPILIVALGTAISQGSAVLGALTMGCIALGMGILLILFGFGADWLLPKTGHWMTYIQDVFGFSVLGVAIYLLDSLSIFSTLYLWAALLVCTGFYFHSLAKLANSFLLRSILRTLSFTGLLWGSLVFIGGLTNNDEQQNTLFNPLDTIITDTPNSSSSQNTTLLSFQHTTSLSQVNALLTEAKNNTQPVILDFYADWCLDCKRMKKTTYRKTKVHKALDNWQRIEVDVTKTNATSEEVKKHFSVLGPPATLFFNAQGEELTSLRSYGYLDEQALLTLIQSTH